MTGLDSTEASSSDLEEECTDRGFQWGLWSAVVLLNVGTFGAGFLVGVVSDGNAEIMREFRERGSSPPPTSSKTSIADASMTASASTPEETNAVPQPARRPNNQVDWAISIAPGTNVAPMEARNAAPDADTKIEIGTNYGTHISPVATLWVGAASTARIVLPIGDYSMRTTTMPLHGTEERPEAVMTPGVLRIQRDEPGMSVPSVAGDRKGRWRLIQSARTDPQPSGRKRSRPRKPVGEAEYEGLGESSKDGGDSTYVG